MRKLITTAMAGVVTAGAVLAAAAPAYADRRHHRHRGGNDDAVAAAVLGGVAGLALGAALSNGNRRDRGYYDNGYRYDPRYDGYHRGGGYYRGGRDYGYYDRPRYRTCVTRDRVWDPYIGRRVTIERSYRC
ncbi:MAG: hypothetical protein AB1942_25805 [Pseudomonadota bacterium]